MKADLGVNSNLITHMDSNLLGHREVFEQFDEARKTQSPATPTLTKKRKLSVTRALPFGSPTLLSMSAVTKTPKYPFDSQVQKDR